MQRRAPTFAAALATGAILAVVAPLAAPAATLDAPTCVGNDGKATPTLPISVGGFVPGSFVSFRYEAGYLGEPRSAGLFRPDSAGAFAAQLVPPTLASARVARRPAELGSSTSTNRPAGHNRPDPRPAPRCW